MIEDILTIPEPYPTKLYCWGGGGGGTLGIENGAIRKVSLKPCHVELPTTSPAISASAGHYRTAVTTYSRDCYTWGKPPLGRQTSSITSEAVPKRVKGAVEGRVKKTIHGETHSVILTTDGSVFAFGDASDGKLGLRHKTRGQVILPTLVETKTKCIDVACGYASTALLLDCGKGGMTFGKTGAMKQPKNVQKKSEMSFCTLSFPVKFISISGGTSHLAAVSSDGHCYTWGLNCNGRLGHGDEKDYQVDIVEAHPKRIDYFVEKSITVSRAYCGGAHTCVLGEDGRIFSFGWNVYFQCGSRTTCNEKENSDVLVPTEVDMQGRYIVDVSCGFAHSVAIDITGNLWGFGFNEAGQLGLGHEHNVKDPSHIEFNSSTGEEEFAITVSAGKTHTVCITSPYPMSDFFHRIDEITIKRNAIATLRHFFNQSFFKPNIGRLEQIQDENVAISQEAESDQEISQRETVVVEEGTDISSDSWSSWSSEEGSCNYVETNSNGDPPMNENQDDASFRRQTEELHSMELEDERSRQLMKLKQIHANEVRKKKNRVIHEIIRQYESYCMAREDLYSFAQRETEKRKIQERLEMVKKEKILTRDAKAKERIMKEADRMLKAKVKEKTRVLPRRKRKQKVVKRYWTREPVPVKENDSSPDLFSPISFNSEYNRKLLLRRRRRILHREQAVREESERQRKIHEQNTKIKSMMIRKSKQQISDLAAKMDALLTKRKEKTTNELMHLKTSLTATGMENNAKCNFANRSVLRSVAEWSNELG